MASGDHDCNSSCLVVLSWQVRATSLACVLPRGMCLPFAAEAPEEKIGHGSPAHFVIFARTLMFTALGYMLILANLPQEHIPVWRTRRGLAIEDWVESIQLPVLCHRSMCHLVFIYSWLANSSKKKVAPIRSRCFEPLLGSLMLQRCRSCCHLAT